MKLRNYLLPLLLALTAVSLSCSSDSSTGQVPISGGSSPAETAERIISLSPTATEILFALEANNQVVAVDDQSNYPDTAPMTSLSGYTPNIESIAEYQPDRAASLASSLSMDLSNQDSSMEEGTKPAE